MNRIAKVYAAYAKKLRSANALDFDDIIYHTVTLLRQEPEVLEYYQHKFRYVLVDEYQDTNHLQYLLTSLLAGGYKNLCVVGDDDQSIYRFRGANIENILNFEKQYPTPGPSGWSRTTAPPRTSWTPPMLSSATTPAARARPSGPTTAGAMW